MTSPANDPRFESPCQGFVRQRAHVTKGTRFWFALDYGIRFAPSFVGGTERRPYCLRAWDVAPMTTEELLAKFARVRRNGPNDWHVPCPAHDDNTQDPAKFSLHLTASKVGPRSRTEGVRDDCGPTDPVFRLASLYAGRRSRSAR